MDESFTELGLEDDLDEFNRRWELCMDILDKFTILTSTESFIMELFNREVID
jgi:hypothetical protein